jgi:hypothetical protein
MTRLRASSPIRRVVADWLQSADNVHPFFISSATQTAGTDVGPGAFRSER